jgi:hypothetical protein
VRLLGDEQKPLSETVAKELENIAQESDPRLRSQLASSLRRMPGKQSVEILGLMLRNASDRDEHDPHIPLLLWWAIEAKVNTDRDAVLKIVRENSETNIVYAVILPRVARRLVSLN